MYLNKIIIAGFTAADPEVREVSGRKVASFRVGITEKYKDTDGQFQEKTEWVNVVAWGRPAEAAERHVRKGEAVLVEGKIQTRQWNDRDGNKRYSTEVNAMSIQVDKKRTPRQETDQDRGAYDNYGF